MKILNKKTIKLCAALIMGLAILIGGFAHFNAQAAPASELATQINAINGLTATVSADTVTVTGMANLNRTRLNLDISPGVTVNWRADLTAAATANNYAFGLSGGGTFNLENATLTNTGAGGTVYIGPTPINLNINNSGLINSPTSSGSALTITSGIQGVVINVNDGGAIRSVPGGYAINDGSGVNSTDNNTAIFANAGGTIEAGATSAIRSTGRYSVVTVAGGLVTSTPGSNVSPVISMMHEDPPNPTRDNVIINSGTVRTTNSGSLSYVIQTTQNVRVAGGLVQAIAGRAINLVGLNSVATINGGTVTTVSGIAVCTATTNPATVENARIEVLSGIVEATGTGGAIHITGANGSVNISGGQVLARDGYAIDPVNAFPTDGVTVSGGFVFAWGSNIADVISREADKLNNNVGGVIVAWDTATGVGADDPTDHPYTQRESTDLTFLPGGAGVFWDINPDSAAPFDGIRAIGAGLANDFFGLTAEVLQHYFTLTINRKYINTSTGTPTLPETETHIVRAGTVVDIATDAEEPIIYHVGISPAYFPINGSIFNRWESESTNVTDGNFGDITAHNTTFTMPADNATIVATYNPRFLLRVIGGAIDNIDGQRNYDGSANYAYFAYGEQIQITAYTTPRFYNWEATRGGQFQDANSYHTTFYMPGHETAIFVRHEYNSADPPPRPPPEIVRITAEVLGNSGNISGTTTESYPQPVPETEEPYLPGTNLIINARPEGADEVFSHWAIVTGGGFFRDPFASGTEFVMLGNVDIEIEAVFNDIHDLTVIDASGESFSERVEGSRVNITAALKLGHSFHSWTSSYDGHIEGFDPYSRQITFTMPDIDLVLTANYTPIEYTLEVHGGLTPIITQHQYDTSVTVSAPAEPVGMKFDSWVLASGNISPPLDLSSGTLSFSMPAENVVLIATYVPDLYNIEVVSGTSSPPDVAIYGELVTVIPDSPPPDHKFERWEIDATVGPIPSITEDDLMQPELEFSMPANNVRLIAHFISVPPEHYIVTAIGATVPSGYFESNDPVVLTARDPVIGMEFIRWNVEAGDTFSLDTGYDWTDTTIQFRMPGRNIILRAIFEAKAYNIEVDGGTSVPGDTAILDQPVTVSADDPEPDTEFIRWDVEDGENTFVLDTGDFTDEEISFRMPPNDVSLKAIFAYNVTVDGGTPNPAAATAGTNVTVTPNPPTGMRFLSWEVINDSITLPAPALTQNPLNFTMPANPVELRAIFEHIPFAIEVVSGTSSPPDEAIYDQEVTVTADNPAIGMRFDRWEVSSNITPLPDLTQNPLTFRMPADDVKLEAIFERIEYTVTAEGGTPSRPTYHYGDQVTVNPIIPDPPPNQKFLRWEIVEGPIPSIVEYDLRQPVLEFTMPANNVRVRALFVEVQPDHYIVTAHGSTEPSSQHLAGATVNLSARPPAEGMRFDRWEVIDNSIPLSAQALTQNPLTFTMPANNVELRAIFVEITVPPPPPPPPPPQRFTVEARNSTTPNFSSLAGENVTVTAVQPTQGMRFDRWIIISGNIPSLSEADLLQRQLTFRMPAENVVLMATFAFIDPPPDNGDDETTVAAAHNIPLTGDFNNTSIWIALLIASGATIGSVLLIKHKRRG